MTGSMSTQSSNGGLLLFFHPNEWDLEGKDGLLRWSQVCLGTQPEGEFDMKFCPLTRALLNRTSTWKRKPCYNSEVWSSV